MYIFTENITHIECTQRVRRERIANACLTYKDNVTRAYDETDPKTYSRLMVDDRHRVLYCVIPKAGCSSWKSTMAIQNSQNPNQTLLNIQENVELVHTKDWMQQFGLYWLHTLPISDIRIKVKEYYKFMITRHPFDRVVSAYINKLYNDNWYGKRFQAAFKQVFGNGVTLNKFSFIDFLNILGDVNHTTRLQEHVLKRFRQDRHWGVQITYCHPCFIKYNYIAQLETMDVDKGELLPRLGAKKLYQFNVEVRDRLNGTGRYSGAVNYHDVLARYQYKWILQDMYAMDFDAFGYDRDGMRGVKCDKHPCC